jgi:hypothetical protein
MKSLRIILFLSCFALKLLVQAQNHWAYLKPAYYGADYVRQFQTILKQNSIKVIGYSVWLNAFCVDADKGSLATFDFISRVEPLRSYKKHLERLTLDSLAYGRSDWQNMMLGLDSFHRMGFTGKGVTIALMDAGFYKVDSIAAFDSLRQRGQIKFAYDFVDGDSNVYDADAHGMSVLSILAGNIPDSIIGAAPDANYLLFRSEEAGKETHREEFNWLKAMEKADSLGADIIHSSLGYSEFDTLEGDYTYFDMDGKSTIITIAAELAFSKGMFVTNSAGNEGEKPWHYITAPCDGKNVLCIGAVDSFRNKAGFSSFGPSSDGRVKPDVMAMGLKVTIIGSDGFLKTGSGTSFSGPLMAGFVACLKQAHPTMTNDRIFKAIIMSADRYSKPDTAYGYGIPNILKADSILNVLAKVDRFEATFYKAYPNPGMGSLTLESKALIEEISIVGIEGRKVLHEVLSNPEYKIKLNAENFKEGLYLIRIRTASGSGVLRWICSGIEKK